MDETRRYPLTLETLARLSSETRAARAPALPALPTLEATLNACAPLPRSALFLGLAMDGLPILLNLLDPLTGPLLILGDEGSGKLEFLKTVAGALERVHAAHSVSYTVVSGEAARWQEMQASPNCEQVVDCRDPQSQEALHALVEWAHENNGAGQIRVVLIDHAEQLLRGAAAAADLRWLFFRGPVRRVWPIVAVDAASAASEAFRPWLEMFHTRLFGRIQDDAQARLLAASASASFSQLAAPSQFAMYERGAWIAFWIPAAA